MWTKYQGALLWDANPNQKSPTRNDASSALREMGGLFARWTSDFDCVASTPWWYCICDQFTSIEQLSAKQRYRVNKGLRSVRICRVEDTSINIEALYRLFIESFEDYPKQYRPIIQENEFRNSTELQIQDPSTDIWLAYDTNDTLVGYGRCIIRENVVWLNQVKVPTKYLSLEVNAALVYKICEYYLSEKHCEYICDGERNIKHQTNYQEFLVRVLNFRYAYCKLNIVYKWWMQILVSILYPFKSMLKLAGKHSPFVYNVYCVLKQEQIRRSFNNM